MAHPYWPFFDLAVRTPRLELRYPDDALVDAIADVAAHGIHDPATMPFSVPWTDTPTGGPLERSALQFHWRTRAELCPESWRLPFAVLVDGAVVGMQDLFAVDFASAGTVETGSWLGLEWQGRGLGREMRAAVLHLAFAGLGAQLARTSAFDDNAASLGVTRALGYQPDGQVLADRRGVPTFLGRFALTHDRWHAGRRDDIELVGVAAVRPLLGLG